MIGQDPDYPEEGAGAEREDGQLGAQEPGARAQCDGARAGQAEG